MSIVKGVYEGFTALIYSFILDIVIKVLLLMGFTDILYDLLQLISVILWIGIAMYGWNNVCLINRGVCRLSTIFRFMMFVVTPLMAFSYIFYLYGANAASALLFLISVSLLLGLSVSGYVGSYILSNQFRSNLGRISSLISIIAVLMWLALIPKVMEVGTAINALGNAMIIITAFQLRRRFSPTSRKTHR
ncbi:MAG: hypothetical protein ACP5GY_08340 [Vulcanisaeta sp.]